MWVLSLGMGKRSLLDSVGHASIPLNLMCHSPDENDNGEKSKFLRKTLKSLIMHDIMMNP